MRTTLRAVRVEPGDAGRTVQRLLHERLPASNAEAKGLVAAGCVRRNGRVVPKPDERIEAGDRVEVRSEPGRKYAGLAPSRKRGEGYRMLHEDDDVVVVEKDAGLLTVPAPAAAGDSLLERLSDAYRRRGFRAPGLEVVHRIDRYTSGLVVFARSHSAALALKRQFKERRPLRVYLAVAEGEVVPDAGRLVHALVENPKSLKVYVAADPRDGRRSSLRWRVVERLFGATLLEVTLETGRRNQIRVQLAAEGHALVGDLAYGRPSPAIDRAALHAHRLEFDAPRGRKRLRFSSPLPRDMARLIASLRRQSENSTSTPV